MLQWSSHGIFFLGCIKLNFSLRLVRYAKVQVPYISNSSTTAGTRSMFRVSFSRRKNWARLFRLFKSRRCRLESIPDSLWWDAATLTTRPPAPSIHLLETSFADYWTLSIIEIKPPTKWHTSVWQVRYFAGSASPKNIIETQEFTWKAIFLLIKTAYMTRFCGSTNSKMLMLVVWTSKSQVYRQIRKKTVDNGILREENKHQSVSKHFFIIRVERAI